MNNHRRYRITTLLVTIMCLLFSMSTMALAAGPGKVDKNSLGSINIKFVDTDEKPITGGNIEIFYIASVVEDADGNDAYELTDDFKGLTIDYTDLGSSEFIANAETIIDANELVGMSKDVDADGFAYFGELPVGMYLITQPKANDGWYAINSYIVTIPLENSGQWMYDITSVPKMEPYCEKDTSGITTPPVTPTPDVTPSVTPSVTPVPSSTPTPVPTVTNTPTPTPVSTSGSTGISTDVEGGGIPQTGKLNWPIPVLSFLGITLILTGWAVKKCGKR